MDIQNYINIFKKEYSYDDLFDDRVECDAEQLCKEMGFENANQLVGVLLEANKSKLDRIIQYEEIISMRDHEIQQLNKTIEELRERYSVSNPAIHNIKAKYRKHTTERKATPYTVAVYLHMDKPDKVIMEQLDISRTTLWRAKKEIEKMGGTKEVLRNLPF